MVHIYETRNQKAAKLGGGGYVKTKYEFFNSFSHESLKFFSSQSSGPPPFASCQNCMSSANLVTEIH